MSENGQRHCVIVSTRLRFARRGQLARRESRAFDAECRSGGTQEDRGSDLDRARRFDTSRRKNIYARARARSRILPFVSFFIRSSRPLLTVNRRHYRHRYPRHHRMNATCVGMLGKTVYIRGDCARARVLSARLGLTFARRNGRRRRQRQRRRRRRRHIRSQRRPASNCHRPPPLRGFIDGGIGHALSTRYLVYSH